MLSTHVPHSQIRREDARQGLALTRLRNFYADVRSAAVFQNLRGTGKGRAATRSSSPKMRPKKPISAGVRVGCA